MLDKLLKIAEDEVGYLEKKSNAQLDDKTANAGDKNYTKYWRDLAPSMNGNYWCGTFINWCFQKAFGKSMALKLLCAKSGYSYYTPTMAGYFKSEGRFFKNNPQKGDVIFFQGETRINHVGLVINVDKQYVYTIEGNTSSVSGVVRNGGSVNHKKYLLTNKRIAGYGRPNYSIADSKQSSNPYPEPTKNLKKGAKGDGVKWLQYELVESGYDLKIDGDFGQLTSNALLDFQKKFNLETDSILGRYTREALKKV